MNTAIATCCHMKHEGGFALPLTYPCVWRVSYRGAAGTFSRGSAGDDPESRIVGALRYVYAKASTIRDEYEAARYYAAADRLEIARVGWSQKRRPGGG